MTLQSTNAVRLTIVTPALNAAAKIRACLESVSHQGLAAEHLVMDGASTDGTLSQLKAWKLHPVTVVSSSERDRGIFDAMNKGISRASGNVIGLLNADDFYASNDVLERVADVFDDPAVDACYGDLLYVDCGTADQSDSPTFGPSGCRTVSQSGKGDLVEMDGQLCLPREKVVRVWRAGHGSARSFYHGWMPPHPTFFARRRVYERVGLFRLDLGSAADYEFLLRAIVKHRIRIAYLPMVLVKMRVGGVSNASLRNRLCANRMDRQAWNVNGLRPFPWTRWLKPLRKVSQWRLLRTCKVGEREGVKVGR